MKLSLILIALSFTTLIHAAEKPNVPFIAVDDMRDWMGATGHAQAKTPNFEWTNLANKPEHAAIKTELAKQLPTENKPSGTKEKTVKPAKKKK